MKGYSVTEYGRGYQAGRRYAKSQVLRLQTQIKAMQKGVDVLAAMVLEERAARPSGSGEVDGSDTRGRA